MIPIQQRKYGALGSSVDANKISMTIKSLGIAMVPVILAILKATGFESFTENDIVVVINGLATVVATIGVIWGVVRKFKK